MKTKLIATTLLVGALTTSVLAHGNNMQGMNCMNGQMMEQGMKMHNNMNCIYRSIRTAMSEFNRTLLQ